MNSRAARSRQEHEMVWLLLSATSCASRAIFKPGKGSDTQADLPV